MNSVLGTILVNDIRIKKAILWIRQFSFEFLSPNISELIIIQKEYYVVCSIPQLQWKSLQQLFLVKIMSTIEQMNTKYNNYAEVDIGIWKKITTFYSLYVKYPQIITKFVGKIPIFGRVNFANEIERHVSTYKQKNVFCSTKYWKLYVFDIELWLLKLNVWRIFNYIH